MNDRAGFVLRSIEGRLALARCLVARGDPGDHKRARALRRQAQGAAVRIGMSHLVDETSTPQVSAPVAITVRPAARPDRSVRISGA